MNDIEMFVIDEEMELDLGPDLEVLEDAVDGEPSILELDLGLGLGDDEEEEGEVEQTWEEHGDHSKFLPYLTKRLKNLPRHSGKTTVGCERVLSVLRKLNKEISQALCGDEDNVIDENEAEKLRDTIFNYIEKLETALNKMMDKKTKKKADLSVGKQILVRLAEGGIPEYYLPVTDSSGEMLLQVEIMEPTDAEVQSFAGYEKGLHKTAGTPKIYLMADPFMNEITRIIIESHVTHGRNIDEVYSNLDKKYKFSDRDHLAIQGLLQAKGMWLNKDLSKLKEEVFPWEGGANSPKVYPA